MRRLSLQTKLIILFLATSIASILTIAWLGYENGKKSLTKAVFDQLTSIRATHQEQIRDRLKLNENLAIVIAENRTVIQAAKEMKTAFAQWGTNPPPADLDARLNRYMDEEYLPRLAKRIDGIPVREQYIPNNQAGKVGMYHYLASNPHPIGKKFDLDDAGDGSEYSRLHARLHPAIRSMVTRFGFQDLIIASADTGTIIYNYEKSPEYGTSLMTGPYADSNLGEMFARLRRSRDKGAVDFADFEFYRPNMGNPAAFIGSPIFDGTELVAVLILQFPIDEIVRIMTGGGQWERQGLGKTGETYLVGADHLMRSRSRFMIEDTENFLRQLETEGVPNRTVNRIRETGSTILLMANRAEYVDKALAGEEGISIGRDYRGRETLASYAPLDIGTGRWAVIAQMEADEAFAPVREFTRNVMVAATGLIMAVTLISTILASRFIRPVRKMIHTAEKIGAGEFGTEVRVTTGDEFGDLARAFNAMIRTLHKQATELEQRIRDNEQLLMNILPGPALVRVKAGDAQGSDTFADVTVLCAEVVGLPEESGSSLAGIELFQELVVAFDEAADRHDVEKVKTAGSSYLAVCGLSYPRPDHTARVVEFALDLPRIIRRFNQERGTALGVEIVVHAGPVVGGVIGRSKFIYELWGPTVAIAKALLRDDRRDEVQVTQVVRDRLQDLYEFRPQAALPGVPALPVPVFVVSI